MKDWFYLQDSRNITSDIIDELKGRSIYSGYQVGDNIYAFLEEIKKEKENEILMYARTVVERDMEQLGKEFNFVRMSGIFPVLERI